jgi:hypothetical protein
MLTNEEQSLLACLRERIVAAVEDLARLLLPGRPAGALERAVWNLGWLGYVDVTAGPRGEARILQITQKGLAEGGGWLPSHADLAVCSPPEDVPVHATTRPVFLPEPPRRAAAIEATFALPIPVA